jgi:hypothetical protein
MSTGRFGIALIAEQDVLNRKCLIDTYCIHAIVNNNDSLTLLKSVLVGLAHWALIKSY